MYLDEAIDQFNEYYGDESVCIELFATLRWPNGFRCPSCNNGQAYRIETRKLPLFQCRRCSLQTSLTAGTVMHRSKTPIRKWLLTMFLMAATTYSVNAVKLSDILDVTYKTAWSMLHRIRRAISETDGQQKLEGHVEAKHELFLADFWMIESRILKEKSVIIARELGSDVSTRYKMKLISNKRKAREPLTEEHALEFAAQYCSSELLSYAVNPKYQFSRYKTVFEQERKMNRTKLISFYTSPSEYAVIQHICDRELTYSLSEIAMNVYSWLSTTFNGISSKYAQMYFDEYCFKLTHARLRGIEKFLKLAGLIIPERESRSVLYGSFLQTAV